MRAIVAACDDAGIDTADVDGFVSYGSEHNDGQRLMSGLGTKELRFAALNWTHRDGSAGAVGLPSAAIIAGQADVVAGYRAILTNRMLAQGVPRSTMTAMVRAAYYHADNSLNTYGRDVRFSKLSTTSPA
jgi:hypothetical protein